MARRFISSLESHAANLASAGRPTVIICFDVHSRMVLGHSVAFDSPSLQNALLALKSVNQPPAIPSDDVARQLPE